MFILVEAVLWVFLLLFFFLSNSCGHLSLVICILGWGGGRGGCDVCRWNGKN